MRLLTVSVWNVSVFSTTLYMLLNFEWFHTCWIKITISFCIQLGESFWGYITAGIPQSSLFPAHPCFSFKNTKCECSSVCETLAAGRNLSRLNISAICHIDNVLTHSWSPVACAPPPVSLSQTSLPRKPSVSGRLQHTCMHWELYKTEVLLLFFAPLNTAARRKSKLVVEFTNSI